MTRNRSKFLAQLAWKICQQKQFRNFRPLFPSVERRRGYVDYSRGLRIRAKKGGEIQFFSMAPSDTYYFTYFVLNAHYVFLSTLESSDFLVVGKLKTINNRLNRENDPKNWWSNQSPAALCQWINRVLKKGTN